MPPASGLSSMDLTPLVVTDKLSAMYGKFTAVKGVSLGLEMQVEKDKLDVSVEEQMKVARIEADRILADASKEAGSIIKAAEERAGEKVEGMITDAHARIADDVRKAKKELEREVTSLVAEATEVIINEKLDAKKDESLIKRALSGIKL